MKKTTRIVLIGISLLLAFSVFSGISAAGSVPGVTDDTILIGGLMPLAGPLSMVGVAVRDGWQMAFDEVNEAGGINGRKIKVLWEDTSCVPSKGLAAIKKLITRDQVFALAGGLCSNSIAPGVTIIEKAKVPYFTSHVSDPGITHPTKKYIFRAANIPGDYQGRSAAMLAVDFFHENKIGILHVADEFGVSTRDGILEYLKKIKVAPTTAEAFNPGDPDYTAQLANLKNSGSKAVIIIAYPPDGAKIVVQAKKKGLKFLWIAAPPLGEPGFAAMAGDAAIGLVHVNPTDMLVTDTHLPMMAKWREAFRKRIGETRGRPGPSELMSYGAAQVFCEGLRMAGRDLTRERFVDSLESIKDFDKCILGKISFSKDNHQGNIQSRFGVWLPNRKHSLLKFTVIGK